MCWKTFFSGSGTQHQLSDSHGGQVCGTSKIEGWGGDLHTLEEVFHREVVHCIGRWSLNASAVTLIGDCVGAQAPYMGLHLQSNTMAANMQR